MSHEAPRQMSGAAALAAIALVLLIPAPALLTRFGFLAPSVEFGTLLFDASVVAAAFAMSWAAEAAERDVPRALSLIVVALLAVLPEYAVDIVFAWKAGHDPAFAPYAVANMTGSNRLLLGVGWSTIALLAWASQRRRLIALDRGGVVAVGFLAAATLYSFTLVLRREIALIDSVLLAALFAGYAIWAARSATEETRPGRSRGHDRRAPDRAPAVRRARAVRLRRRRDRARGRALRRRTRAYRTLDRHRRVSPGPVAGAARERIAGVPRRRRPRAARKGERRLRAAPVREGQSMDPARR